MKGARILSRKQQNMSRKKVKKPTEAELEILEILWRRQPASVRQVHEELAGKRATGYTTTLKLMQIMAEKGMVTRDTSRRTHLYTAVLSREEVQDSMLKKLLGGVFRGASGRLAMQLLGHDKPGKEEIQKIKALLEQWEEE